MIKKVTISLLGLILLFSAWVYWAANPHFGEINEEINHDLTYKVQSGDTLRLLTFNMAYAYGIGSDGVGYQKKPKEVIYERLKSMALMLNDFKVDIALIQEIDFDADRSGNKHQAAFLAELTTLKNYVTTVGWDANYVPFPYFPIENHFGKIRSGGAILSRFPIKLKKSILLQKPEANPWWYNLFYLSRFVHIVEVNLGFRSVSLANMHLEAFDISNRENQAELIVELLKSESQLLAFGGDMNSLPPYAKQFHDFDDVYGDDYRNDNTQTIIRSGLSTFVEPLSSQDSLGLFTFPALKPNRQLDYLFIRDSVQVLSYEVLPVGDLSDHLPVLLTFVIN